LIKIYVDADACPVKEEVLKVAARHSLNVYIVSNSWVKRSTDPNVHIVLVESTPDAADDWITEHIHIGHIAVTADIKLAARCLKKGAEVVGPAGKPFTLDNIGTALAMRELSAHLRETGESKGYNPSFTKQDRSRFLQTLEDTIQRINRARGSN
jgi:uncharacterized protein YaiI (UPF0178 family)